MKVATGALAADFFLHFGASDFPFQIPFKKYEGCLKGITV
jgi:hypothetical protein